MRLDPQDQTDADRLLTSTLREALETTAPAPAARESIGERRRSGRAPTGATRGLLRVIDRNGVVQLEDAGEAALPGLSRRRRARAVGLGGQVLDEVPFERLPPNEVVGALSRLDDRLTPLRGLRALEEGRLSPPGAPPAQKGRVLLLVHGTFSDSDQLRAELEATKGGCGFLARAAGEYDQVLFFDHPTVSVGPMLNARALALALAGSEARVDVVCHSRGGLLARWWTEVLDREPRVPGRVVFVGCPLAGTGLAAPPRLRATISLLATFSRALAGAAGMAGAAVPLATVAAEFFRIASSLAGFAARAPLVDAAVALMPGIAAMSRVGNNAELLSQRLGRPDPARCFAVRADFQSEQVGWQFWKAFRSLGKAVADTATDVVFGGPNDLVVDTDSMADLSVGAGLPPAAVLDFGTTDRVHHTNYFRQPETVDFLTRVLLDARR